MKLKFMTVNEKEEMVNKQVEVVELGPDDHLLIHLQGQVPEAQVVAFRRRLKEKFRRQIDVIAADFPVDMVVIKKIKEEK